MSISPIASALSTCFSNSYFYPCKQNDLAFNNKKSNTKNIIDINQFVFNDTFNILLPSNNFIDLNLELAPFRFLKLFTLNSIVESYTDGILLADINTLYFYDYNLKLTKSIKNVSNSSKIIFLKNINNTILVLSENQWLYLLDPVSGSILFSIKLSYHFTYLKEFIHFDHEISTKYSQNKILALYTESTCCQLVELDLKLNQLFLFSPLIYLTFWPNCFAYIKSNFYFFDYDGSYQMFKILPNLELILLTDSKKKLDLLDENFGKLLNIYKFDMNNNSFIFIQEKGWSIFELDINSQNKVNNIDFLTLSVSSALPSPHEKCICFENNRIFILMSNHMITFINNNQIQLIECNNEKNLLNIIPDYRDNKLVGIFSKEGIYKNNKINASKYMKILDEYFNWINVPQNEKNISKNLICYCDHVFTIVKVSNRLILKNTRTDLEICTLFEIDDSYIEIIDLNLFFNDLNIKYYLLVDKKINFHLFVLDNQCSKLIQSINISKITTNDSNVFEQVYYLEDFNILKFKSNIKSHSLYFNLDDLTCLTPNVKINKATKLLIFSNSNFNKYNLTPFSLFDNVQTLKINEFLDKKKIIQAHKWIGISNNDTEIIFYQTDKSLLRSPELFLLHNILGNDNSLLKIEDLINQNSNLNNFIKRITQFCISENESIVEYSIYSLYTILLKDRTIVKSIYDMCIKSYNENEKTIKKKDNDSQLINLMIILFCISIDEEAFNGYKDFGNLFNNIAEYMLTLNDNICEICIEILSKFSKYGKISTNSNNNFDIIGFLNKIFLIRSEFFNNSKKRNLKSFQRCTNYLDLLLKEDSFSFVVIVSTIIENHAFEIESKKSVLDYIVYVMLEAPQIFIENDDCSVLLYLITNSVISFLSNFSTVSIFAKDNDALWETITLLFSILKTNFNELVNIQYSGELKDIIFGKSKTGYLNIVLILDILGYCGVVYNKENFNQWIIHPLKHSEVRLKKYDKEIGNDKIDIDDIKQKLKQNLQAGNHTKAKFLKYPLFLRNQNILGIINLESMSIQIWKLNNKNLFKDNINLNLLKDDTILLKVPDLNMILLQYIWNKYLKKNTNENSNIQFDQVLKEFYNRIVERTTPSNSPQSSPKKFISKSLIFNVTYSKLDEVYEPIGEYQFGFLLLNYLNAFPKMLPQDISMEVSEDDCFQLNINNRAAFMFT